MTRPVEDSVFIRCLLKFAVEVGLDLAANLRRQRMKSLACRSSNSARSSKENSGSKRTAVLRRTRTSLRALRTARPVHSLVAASSRPECRHQVPGAQAIRRIAATVRGFRFCPLALRRRASLCDKADAGGIFGGQVDFVCRILALFGTRHRILKKTRARVAVA